MTRGCPATLGWVSPDYPWDDVTFEWVDGGDIPAWLLREVFETGRGSWNLSRDVYVVTARVPGWVTHEELAYRLELAGELRTISNVLRGRRLGPGEPVG